MGVRGCGYQEAGVGLVGTVPPRLAALPGSRRPTPGTARPHGRHRAPSHPMTRPPRRLQPSGGVIDCVGVDVTEGTPACAAPSKKYPQGRTGTVAGHSAHQTAGERPCLSCREAFRTRVRELIVMHCTEGRGGGPDSAAPACAEPSKRYPDGRAGTVAGYSAHWKVGEPACKPCTDAWSAKTAARKASLSPDRLKRERARITANANLRRKTTNACLATTPEHPGGLRGTPAGYVAHIVAGQNPCQPCREVSYSHWSACERPTPKHPAGRKGTRSGYHAHVYAQETACDECLRETAKIRAKARVDDPYLALRDALWSKYRLSLEAYRSLLEAQDYRCAICGVDTPTDIRTNRFHVDHDHSCCPGNKSCGACVRGLLCHACNTALGNFQDDPKRLTSALAYLASGGTGSVRTSMRDQRYRKSTLAGSGVS